VNAAVPPACQPGTRVRGLRQSAPGSARAREGIPAEVAVFRAGYRAEHIGPRYSGWAHFTFTTLGSLAVIGLSLSRVAAPSWLELSTIPATFLFANFAEYRGHRGPMHHKTRVLALLHRRHTRQHHRFYTHDAMQAESARDFQMVLFPPAMLFFFLGALACPIGALLFFLVGANVGWLFVATAMSYFLCYEWLHWAYHQPEASWVGRIPGMATLRRHHTHHHDPRLMQRHNFNISFPLCDLLFNTRYRG
jgi:hypothetical protein